MRAHPSVCESALKAKNAGVASVGISSSLTSNAYITKWYRCSPVPAGGAAPINEVLLLSFFKAIAPFGTDPA